MVKKALSIAVYSLLNFGIAQNIQTVYINGQPVQATSVSVNGNPALQILISDLKNTGALTQGGSNPVDAIQGCQGQTLFNGVIRISLIEAKEGKSQASNDPEYQVIFKISNGLNKNLLPPSNSGLDSDYIWLADEEGHATQMNNWIESMSSNQNMLPGSNLTVGFRGKLPGFTPTRVLWRPDPQGINNDLPWAKVRNMEFSLKCK